MNFSFHPEAEIEFLEAIEYFEICNEELGLDFSRQVYRTIRRITEFPYAATPLDNRFRRSLVKRFQYGLIYEILEVEIVIQAVMHLSRNPEYWKSRNFPN